jgi:hypothetical protein
MRLKELTNLEATSELYDAHFLEAVTSLKTATRNMADKIFELTNLLRRCEQL